MRTFMTAIVIALGTGGFAASASAQEPALTAALGQVKEGTSIAIREADGARTTGRLESSTNTLMTLTTRDGRSLSVPLDRVRRLWVDDPVSDGLIRGAGIGAASGAAAALALCGSYNGNCDGGAAMLLMGAIGAGAGAAIGGITDKMHVRILFTAGQNARPGETVRAGVAMERHANGNAPLSAPRRFRTGIGLGFSW